jgi:hypothetical protein
VTRLAYEHFGLNMIVKVSNAPGLFDNNSVKLSEDESN